MMDIKSKETIRLMSKKYILLLINIFFYSYNRKSKQLLKQIFLAKSSLIFLIITHLIGFQSVAQKINFNKAQYLLGDTIQIKITPDGNNSDSEVKIIDISKLKNLVYESDTNTYEPYADAELIKISDDTIVKDNKIILSPKTSLNLQLRIYSLGVFKLLQNESDSSHIIIDDLDSLNVQADIKDILPIFEDDSFDWSWLYYVIGLLILTLITYYLFKNKDKFFKPKSVNAKVLKEQYLLTLESLELMKMKSWTLEEAKTFQSELTEVLRKYLEHYFEKNAMSLTSDELLKSLQLKIVKTDLLKDLNELFSIADLVKFAKARPDVGLFSEAVDKAIHFVNETKMESKS